MTRWMLGGALASALLGLVLAAPARGQDDTARKVKKEIEQLREKMERAEKDGNWEDYVRLQKRIRALQEELERPGKGEGSEDGKRELEEFAAHVKARLAQVPEGEREEALRRLIENLKEQGQADRAKVAAQMLEALRKGGGEDPREAFEKKLQELRRELDKAERDFDFERADKLRAHVRALEEKLEAQRREGRDRPDGKDFEARRKALFEELARARERGDKERVAAIEREIAEITRGKREGGGGEDGRARPMAILEKAMVQFREWAEEARKGGEHDFAGELESGIGQIEALRESLERANDPASREALGAELAKALIEVRGEAGKLKAAGQEKKAKMVAWAADRLQEVHDCLRPGPGPLDGRPGAKKGLRLIEEVQGKMRAWADEAEGAGRPEEAAQVRKGIADVEKFRAVLQTARGPEAAEQAQRMVAEGVARLEQNRADAVARGEERQAERLQWLAERLREMGELLRGGGGPPEPEARDRMREKAGRAREEVARLLAEARNLEEQGRPDEAAELRKKADGIRAEVEKMMREGGPGGRPEEKPELGRRLRMLMEELRRAETEEGGDSKSAQMVREKIAELRRQMGPGAREGAEPRGEEEVQRLRKELDGLRKEMKELRQLLQELLKEGGGEEKEPRKEKKDKDKGKKDKEGEEH